MRDLRASFRMHSPFIVDAAGWYQRLTPPLNPHLQRPRRTGIGRSFNLASSIAITSLTLGLMDGLPLQLPNLIIDGYMASGNQTVVTPENLGLLNGFEELIRRNRNRLSLKE